MYFPQFTVLAYVPLTNFIVVTLWSGSFGAVDFRAVGGSGKLLSVSNRANVEPDNLFFARNLDQQLYARDILDSGVLHRGSDQGRLESRVLTHEEVEEKLKQLEDEVDMHKKAAKTYPHFKEGARTGYLPYSSSLRVMSAFNAANKDKHVARKDRKEQEIAEQVKELNAEGRKDDASKLEIASDASSESWHKYWKQLMDIHENMDEKPGSIIERQGSQLVRRLRHDVQRSRLVKRSPVLTEKQVEANLNTLKSLTRTYAIGHQNYQQRYGKNPTLAPLPPHLEAESKMSTAAVAANKDKQYAQHKSLELRIAREAAELRRYDREPEAQRLEKAMTEFTAVWEPAFKTLIKASGEKTSQTGESNTAGGSGPNSGSNSGSSSDSSRSHVGGLKQGSLQSSKKAGGRGAGKRSFRREVDKSELIKRVVIINPWVKDTVAKLQRDIGLLRVAQQNHQTLEIEPATKELQAVTGVDEAKYKRGFESMMMVVRELEKHIVQLKDTGHGNDAEKLAEVKTAYSAAYTDQLWAGVQAFHAQKLEQSQAKNKGGHSGSRDANHGVKFGGKEPGGRSGGKNGG